LVKNYQESLKPKSGKTIKANPSFSVSEMDKKEIGTTFGTKVDIKVAAKWKRKNHHSFHSESDFQRIISFNKRLVHRLRPSYFLLFPFWGQCFCFCSSSN
jgi:hypothetical protein